MFDSYAMAGLYSASEQFIIQIIKCITLFLHLDQI